MPETYKNELDEFLIRLFFTTVVLNSIRIFFQIQSIYIKERSVPTTFTEIK